MSDFPDLAQLANIGSSKIYTPDINKTRRASTLRGATFSKGSISEPIIQEGSAPDSGVGDATLRIERLKQAYRRYGHLLARFNPWRAAKNHSGARSGKARFFHLRTRPEFPDAWALRQAGGAPERDRRRASGDLCIANRVLSNLDLSHPELEKWIEERIEPQLIIQPSIEEKHLLLEYLYKSEVLETFLNTKYVGQTRFSLEGGETMIPMIAEIIDYGAGLGVEELQIGMAHRGRLNVLTNIINKPYSAIFHEFEDDTTLSLEGSDDVRVPSAFQGSSKRARAKKSPSRSPPIRRISNRSTRSFWAKCARSKPSKNDASRKKIVPCSSTATPRSRDKASSTSRFSSPISQVIQSRDAASRRQQSDRIHHSAIGGALDPLLHRHREDLRSSRLPCERRRSGELPFRRQTRHEIRQKFGCDVFIDLLCYRKYGQTTRGTSRPLRSRWNTGSSARKKRFGKCMSNSSQKPAL